jgi:hypothetical protein
MHLAPEPGVEDQNCVADPEALDQDLSPFPFSGLSHLPHRRQLWTDFKGAGRGLGFPNVVTREKVIESRSQKKEEV